MATRSKQLAVAAQNSAAVSNTVVYTVPASYTTIVKDIQLGNYATTAATANVEVYTAGGLQIFLIYTTSLAGDTTTHWTGWVVLMAGDALRWSTNQQNSQLLISGSELVGP
jgi:hypothetical protein